MVALCRSLPLVFLSPPLQFHLHSPLAKTHLPNPNLCPKSPSGVLKSATFRRKTAKYGSKSNDRIEPSFMDENGVVGDMEGYLNSLSLEYDSVWDTKPYCWIILHSVIVTALASSLIGAWWYIFLYSYPKSYSEMIAERRKRVASGMEDIYGLKNNEL